MSRVRQTIFHKAKHHSTHRLLILKHTRRCRLSIGPIATEVLAALQSKAGTYGYKIAVVPEEGSLPYPQLVSLISEANLTSVSVAPPPGSSDSAVLASLKQSTGVPYSEMLIFACTLELIRAGNRCGALTVPASTTGLTAQLLSDGLQRFEQHQLDQHGFGQNKFSYWRTLFKGAETCNP